MVAQVTGEVLQFRGLGATAMKMGGCQGGVLFVVRQVFLLKVHVLWGFWCLSGIF
jgi:hypothetical protein